MVEKIATVVSVVPTKKAEPEPSVQPSSSQQTLFVEEESKDNNALEPVESIPIVTAEQADLNHPRDPNDSTKPYVKNMDFTQAKPTVTHDRVEGKTFEDVVKDVSTTRPCSVCMGIGKQILIKSSKDKWVCLNCVADVVINILKPRKKNGTVQEM